MGMYTKYFSAPEYVYEGTVVHAASFSALGANGTAYIRGDYINNYLWIGEAQFSALSVDSPVVSVGGFLRNGNISDAYITYSARSARQALIAPSGGGTPTWRTLDIADINNLTTSLNGKEPSISTGGGDQVWKGNKAWGYVQYSEVADAPSTWSYSAITSVPNNRILGRKTSGTGAAEALSAADVISILGLTGWATKAYTNGSTTDVAEGTNLYYTDVRVNTVINSLKGAASGLVPLGADSKINSIYLPSIAISDTFVVASSAAQVALTAQTGDVAIRTDINKSFILQVNDPSVLANWQELLTPTAGVSSVNGQNGVVTLTTTEIAEGTNQYFTQTRVRSTTLSGYTPGSNTALSATDTILQAYGKVQGQLDAKEPSISTGTSSYVWHGNKTFGPVLWSEISGAPSTSSVKYSASFVGSSVWEIGHGFNTVNTSTVCYVGGKEIDATIIVGSSTNSACFVSAKTGYAVVFG